MANAEAMCQSASVVSSSRQPGKKAILVVVSAMSGVTEQLRNAINSAIQKGADDEFPGTAKGIGSLLGSSEMAYPEIFRANADRHHGIIETVVEPKQAGSLHQMVDDRSTKAVGYVEAMAKLKFLSLNHFDWICGKLGEGFSAPIMAAHLQGSGIDAVYYDAAQVVVTDSIFGNASPLINGIRDRIKDGLLADLNKSKVAVMGGYYGADRNGNVTTFSRGGSDLSATAMGHALITEFNPISACLYKADVAGVMSADPRIVINPHVVPHMLYEEAAALTAMGGKVIHPKAIHHAVRSGSSKRLPFPIYVKSTLDPNSPGTMIDNQERPGDYPIKAVSVIKNAVRLEVRGWGMDRPGIMRKITGALAARGVDIDFIGQPHSKLALDLAFQFDGKEGDLEKAIREELSEELKGNDVDLVRANRVGVVGVIGNGLSDPLILRRVIEGMNGDFPELKQPNAYKLTTGAFEASILVDLSEERLKELAQSVHNAIFDYQAVQV